jgi:hypothetical protein
MDRAEITVRNMLTAIGAPLYDIGVLSDRGMVECPVFSVPVAVIETGLKRSWRWREARSILRSRL